MMGQGLVASQPRIATLVSRVLSLLETLISAVDDGAPEGATVVSHIARFKLWVGSLGAHRLSGSRSLEYRLRDASSIRNHVISLLQDLCDSVDEGVSAANETSVKAPLNKDDGDAVGYSTDAELEEYFRNDNTRGASELGDILDEIGHTVDCLLRLSITIRNPAPHDHFKSRAGAELADLYEPWDVGHVRGKFPKAEPAIAERLGKAISRRRQYFKYREEHAHKLAEGMDEGVGEASEAVEEASEGGEREKATTIASSIPNHLKGLETTEDIARFDDSESNVSKTSYALSTADEGLLRIPPLPKEHAQGPFKCPFCCMIVSIHTRYDWKKHVFRDLRPYICLSSSCATAEQQYLRRSDWIDHMKQDHWRTWSCPFNCLPPFHSKLEFGAHIKEAHGREARSLDTLESLSSQLDLTKTKAECPLCLAFKITSDKHYASHVAAHLEQLALFPLPSTSAGGEDSDGDDSESNKEVGSQDKSGSFDSDNRNSDVKSSLSGGESGRIFANPGTNVGPYPRSDSNEGSDSGFSRRPTLGELHASLYDQTDEVEGRKQSWLDDIPATKAAGNVQGRPKDGLNHARRNSDPGGEKRERDAESNIYTSRRGIETRHSIVRDWVIIDVPPGTERVRLDGAGGTSAQVTWQKYSGVRRCRFIPGRDDGDSPDHPPPTSKRREIWTEITKDLIIREAIEEVGYDYEETEYFFYIMEYLIYDDVLRLVALSDAVRRAPTDRVQHHVGPRV
ncbi:uncharacterized protein B0H64DRAFT_170265 [Chaetomium fimeti]|uniref:C2H2-type domain-containing protein n=1 Tax=Chaetomium fimeti TaxID=1854472 RepID=A0AAE0LTP3_9PEZI|nr:hypothetical protein B0H64DRAFT_170265 [Chaetomium fimeti]